MGVACARTAGAVTGAAASATPPAAACLSSERRSTPLRFSLVLVIVVLPKVRSFLARFSRSRRRARAQFGRQPTVLTVIDLRGGVSQCQRCLARRPWSCAASGSLPSKRGREPCHAAGKPLSFCRPQPRAEDNRTQSRRLLPRLLGARSRNREDDRCRRPQHAKIKSPSPRSPRLSARSAPLSR